MSKIKEKSKIVNERSGNSVGEQYVPTDTAQGLKEEVAVEEKIWMTRPWVKVRTLMLLTSKVVFPNFRSRTATLTFTVEFIDVILTSLFWK